MKTCKQENCTNPAFSKGYCTWHMPKKPIKAKKKPIRPRSPLKKVSDPRAKQIAVYRLKKKEFLMKHPICQFPNCNRPSAIIHHRKHRENERLLDEEFWMALCGGEEPCHKTIHAFPEESYRQGWLIKG